MKSLVYLAFIGTFLLSSAFLVRFVSSSSVGLIIAEASSGGTIGKLPSEGSSMMWVPDNYSTIQAAINAASNGDTIYVRSGKYLENVKVNKTVKLIGLGFPEVWGYKRLFPGLSGFPTFSVVKENVTISGFVVAHVSLTVEYDPGIALGTGCTVNNNIIRQNLDGIQTGYNNTIENNTIIDNWGSGIVCAGSYNIIRGNIIANTGGVFLPMPSNTVIENTISNNSCGVLLWYGNNTIFHNNFINNTIQAMVDEHLVNTWDDGYPSGGNYWSHLNISDQYCGAFQNEFGDDGIIDTPRIIDNDNQDRYPLAAPYNNFETTDWNETAYHVDVVTNSTLSNFQLNETQKTISFNVTGPDGTLGFCRITIPNALIYDLWQNHYTILVNGQPILFKRWTDTENTYLYLTYPHSEHQIVIIPELPPTDILLTTIALTTLSVTIKKKTTENETRPNSNN